MYIFNMDEEILKQANDERLEALEKYLKMEKKLENEGNGFIDKITLDKRNAAKIDWQEKHNRFYGMLSKMKDNDENQTENLD